MKKDKEISQIDLDTWKNYIKNPSDINDKEESAKSINSNNYRFKYDLHGHTLFAANTKVKEIILSCIKASYKEILLITGKGIHSNTDKDIYASNELSKLRYSVPEYIKSNNDISKYVHSVNAASKKDGGEGALIIKLKKL